MVPTDALVSSIRCISSSVMPARAPIAHEGPPSTFEALKPHNRLSHNIRARPSCQGADLCPPAHCWRPWAQPSLEPRSSRAAGGAQLCRAASASPHARMHDQHQSFEPRLCSLASLD